MKAEKLINDVRVVLADAGEVPADVASTLMSAPELMLDLETTGLSPWRDEVALVQLYDERTKTALLLRTPEDWQPDKWFIDLFARPRLFVGHNISQFDLHFLANAGVPWDRSRYYDTLVAEGVVASADRHDVSKSLRASVKRRTGMVVDKDIEHGGWRNEELSDKQLQYAVTDVLVLPELKRAQLEKAEETEQTGAVDMEMEVLPTFVRMTLNGLPINLDNLDEYIRQQEAKAADAEGVLRARLGNINFNSSVQLKKALAAAGIEMDSTRKESLVDTILFDPESENAKLLQAILDWRAPNKRTSMYGSEEWRAKFIAPDGRVHARFWQAGTDTFRVSSSDPNLQQVPKDGRWIFGGLAGHKMVSCDYSQIEVRIAAEVAGDDVLMEMLDKEDVHTAIASAVFKVPPDQVSKRIRKLAKAMVFTLLFGGSPQVLYNYARRNGSDITFEEATGLFVQFFDTFQGLGRTRQKAKAIASSRKVLVIRLPNGGRRVLVGQKLSPQVILNTTVQGPAAIGMKFGMIEAGKRGLDCYLGATVHDELVACVPDREVEDYSKELEDAMLVGMRKVVHKCPVKAECKVGDVWQP